MNLILFLRKRLTGKGEREEGINNNRVARGVQRDDSWVKYRRKVGIRSIEFYFIYRVNK